MTTITITRTNSDKYKSVECIGHAGFADYGKDIVCAAVSVLTINLVNSVDTLTDDEIEVTQDEDKGIIRMKFINEPCHDSEVLVKAFELGVDSIFKQYGKKFLNIKFRRE